MRLDGVWSSEIIHSVVQSSEEERITTQGGPNSAESGSKAGFLLSNSGSFQKCLYSGGRSWSLAPQNFSLAVDVNVALEIRAVLSGFWGHSRVLWSPAPPGTLLRVTGLWGGESWDKWHPHHNLGINCPFYGWSSETPRGYVTYWRLSLPNSKAQGGSFHHCIQVDKWTALPKSLTWLVRGEEY
jgi:hypothetical protein